MLYKLSWEYSLLLIMDVCLVAVFWLQVALISLHPHRYQQSLRPGFPWYPKKSLPGKNNVNSGLLFGKSHNKQGKTQGKICLDSMAFGVHLMRRNSPLFWKSKRYLNVFSTGTEKRRFTGFSVLTGLSGRETEPDLGLFSSRIHTLIFQRSPMKDK